MPLSPLASALLAFTVVTAAWLLFAAFELAGLTLPGWHTVSFLAHNYPPLRYALVVLVFLFDLGLWWHFGQPVAK